MTLHGTDQPSAWVSRWAHLVPPASPVLDVACGAGRHMRLFRDRGHPVCGVDRSAEAIEAVRDLGEAVLADIENRPWPFAGRHFGGVVVTNYLWRALMPTIAQSVGPSGILLYETFAAGNETVGKPSRPDFLLRPGELIDMCQGLRVIAYEDGFLSDPPRFVQRVVAVREERDRTAARYTL